MIGWDWNWNGEMVTRYAAFCLRIFPRPRSPRGGVAVSVVVVAFFSGAVVFVRLRSLISAAATAAHRGVGPVAVAVTSICLDGGGGGIVSSSVG